ncbi:MAG: VapC toxin family PIN domain ribonuclease [Desulfobulbaceae bacterium A2]|nr:MAG: VapC toxin family PIN domain ribonuclease [Desulfobulbaceae bacterium A2]
MNGDKVYLDTSALLPYYREEPASQKVQAFLDTMRPPVLLSDLTKVEVVSAIARWVRLEEITEPQAALLENTFAQDSGAGLFVFRPVTMTHYQQAEKWLSARKTALRTLDALHVACCCSQQARLVTCDSIMYQAAITLGIESQLISTDDAR